jgi:hypothetical protein
MDCRNHIITIPGFNGEDPVSGECADENAVAVFDSSETPPNRTLASIFDEDCEVILDENDEPILGALA